MGTLLHPQQREVQLAFIYHSLNRERQACHKLRQARCVRQGVRHQPRLLRTKLVVPAPPQRVAHRDVAACEHAVEMCERENKVVALMIKYRPLCQLCGPRRV